MLKTTELIDISRPEVGNGKSKIVEFSISGGSEDLAKKLGKLKGQKLAKFQKSLKSRKSKGKKSKKPSKSGNSPNFDAMKAGPNFPTPGTRKAFNCLLLAFTKTPIN